MLGQIAHHVIAERAESYGGERAVVAVKRDRDVCGFMAQTASVADPKTAREGPGEVSRLKGSSSGNLARIVPAIGDEKLIHASLPLGWRFRRLLGGLLRLLTGGQGHLFPTGALRFQVGYELSLADVERAVHVDHRQLVAHERELRRLREFD